jgi:hypothetical protein
MLNYTFYYLPSGKYTIGLWFQLFNKSTNFCEQWGRRRHSGIYIIVLHPASRNSSSTASWSR